MMLGAIKRHSLGQWFLRNIVSIVTLAALFCCIYTYLVITHEGAPLGVKPGRVVRWLTIDFAFLALLLAIIGRRIYSVWYKMRVGSPGSKLQKRILWLFTIVTVTPTVIVSIFAALFFNLGIQAWFNERVQTALNESLAVAEAYLVEHKENIRADARAMARDLSQVAPLAITNPAEFKQILSTQAALRELTESAMFIGNRLVAEGRLSFALAFEHIPEELFERAQNGEVVTMTTEFDKVRALVKIDGIRGGVLLVGRLIDPKVLAHMSKTQGAVNEYNMLRKHLLALEINFELVFLVLIILLLAASVWYGLVFAARLTNPISSLVNAAERIRSGDYSARVIAVPRKDEIGTLSRTFNRMTEQLEAQREELILANRSLDERRRFSEAVLAGVSAGVIALTDARKITIYSRSAVSIMGSIGQHISEDIAIGELLPGIDDMLDEAIAHDGEVTQKTIAITNENKILTLHVRITVERFGDQVEGFIVTFDDISPLIAAQRNAAWADVARRVAHEIKNPLTPIQLSAERLKRKYSKYITEEPENYHKYIDTITRHVADIGKMVEEFVSFARMPTPRFQEVDITALARNAVFSAQVANPTITYENQISEQTLMITADEAQISQVFTNILKNAAESIEAKCHLFQDENSPHDETYRGYIRIIAKIEDERVVLCVEDNGKGFPEDSMDKMFEPYVTTRSKGTGLGLSIVKKIMDDHKAMINIENIDSGGARVTLSFLPHCDINAARTTIDE